MGSMVDKGITNGGRSMGFGSESGYITRCWRGGKGSVRIR